MKEILKQCILVKGALAVRDYIKSIFVQGQVVRPCEEVQEPIKEQEAVAPKVRVKYKKRKKEETVVEEAPVEKPKRKYTKKSNA